MSHIRSKRTAKKVQDLGKILLKEEISARYKQISQILKIPSELHTDEQKDILEFSPEIVKKCQLNEVKRSLHKSRLEELPDSAASLEEKCLKLAAALQRAEHLVVYTGAGISTAAEIPDYRGPNGVWTLKDKGISVKAKSLSDANPTFTHMALTSLVRLGMIKHIVSQNCDGLHVRSGVDRKKLSEIHGNMYIETCTQCKDKREYLRLFDTTEHTGIRRHETGRKCHRCFSNLKDSIIHFGEKGPMESPYCWEEARAAAESADMILCLGTSLKILKKYPCLWCMGRQKRNRPSLYIVNLQWTPKDLACQLKINGNCDFVIRRLTQILNISVPPYQRYYDPLFFLHSPLLSDECHANRLKMLHRGQLITDHNYALLDNVDDNPEEIPQIPDDTEGNSPSPGWYGVGLRSAKMKRKGKKFLS